MKYIKNFKMVFQAGILAILFLTSGSINTETGTNRIDLTKDKELREQVFKQILTNSDLFYEFMNKMMNNPQSMNWMMENGSMMQMMFDKENLQYIMHHNKNMSNYMFNHMMGAAHNDTTLRMQWNDMMKSHEHINMMQMHNQ